jgi:hypothetical protein
LDLPARLHFSTLLILVLALPLAARDLSLTPSEFVVSPGQRIAVAVEGGGTVPGRLRDAALYTPKGVYNVVNLRADGATIVGDATIPARGTLILTVRTTPEIVARERRTSHAKAMVLCEAKDDHYGRVTGLAFEFIPEANPYRLASGDRLPVRLLLHGRPAAGIEVRLAHGDDAMQAAGRTDSAGRIAVPITALGRWRLHAVAREKSAESRAADWEAISTSLTFSLPEPTGP